MEDPQAMALTCLAILTAFYIIKWRTNPLNAIPTVGGPSAPVLSYLAAYNYMRHAIDIINEGYSKFYGSAFKVATLDQWLVIVSGPKMTEELRTRPDDELSLPGSVEDLLRLKYTMGSDITDDPYHTDIIKEKLTRSLPAVLPQVVDELKVAVQEHIPTQGDEWVSVNVVKTMQQIAARTTNRAFVGLPLCRNQAYLDLAVSFTMTVVTDSFIIGRFPRFLKPVVGYMISQTAKSVQSAVNFLKPVIDERKAMMQESGDDWEDKPNDMLQWILEEAIHKKNMDVAIAQRILIVNFAAIHTTATSLTQIIYDLASRPEYIQPLREEVESIIAAEGYTKAAMGKMWKLDSFLKESQRYNGMTLTSLTRKAMVDVTLSDGTFLPKGTNVLAAARPMHYDDANYAGASVFDPFRFSRMREREGEGMKHQYVNTSPEYIAFGHGKHACPGRFFAANELKAMLAYIVLRYDLKMGGDGSRPANIYFADAVIPSSEGCVLFRKRQPLVDF